jgi:hypothetical protein
VIPLLMSKKLHFESELYRRELNELLDSKPEAISRSLSRGDYELFYDQPSTRALHFRLDNGEVIVTGFSHIVF